MSSLHVIARFNWRRAFFFISLTLLLFSACSSRSMELRSASLYPLYVYDPSYPEPVVFAALQVSVEQGDTILKQVSLESTSDRIFWEKELTEEDSPLIRSPAQNSGEEDFQADPPFFAASDDQTRREFFYPWFAGGGSQGLQPGIYEVTLEDFSGNRRTLNVQLDMPSENRIEDIESRIASISLEPESFPQNAYFQIIQLSENGSMQRYDTVSFIREVLSRQNESAAQAETVQRGAAGRQFYFWGAFTDVDMLFLAGPFSLP